jgi:hypothetical protein
MSTITLSLSQALSLAGHNGPRVDAILDRAGVMMTSGLLTENDLVNIESAIAEHRSALRIGEVDLFGETYTADQYAKDCADLHNLWADICRIARFMGLAIVAESPLQ